MAVHAEINAIIQCKESWRAHKLYTHASPCFECAKVIANTTIHRIIFIEAYSDNRGVELLRKLGKELKQHGDVETNSDRRTSG
jgi:dCMP deaminase